MKKLILTAISDPNTEFILSKRTLTHMEASWTELCQSLAKGFIGRDGIIAGGYYVLYGLNNSTPGGGTYTISDGAVLFSNGLGGYEIYLVTGGTITPGGGQTVVITIATTYDAADPATFTDGSLHNVHQINAGTMAAAASGSGSVDYGDLIFNGDNWHTVGGGGEPAFQNAWANASGQGLQFKKLPDGRVMIRGELDPTSKSGATVFTLPAGYRPPAALNFGVMYTDGSTYITPELVGITTGGLVQVNELNAVVSPTRVSLGVIIFDTK